MSKKATIIHNNGVMGLQNGSYTAEKNGVFFSYMNGEYMGAILKVPKHQTIQTDVATANSYLPTCCKQK